MRWVYLMDDPALSPGARELIAVTVDNLLDRRARGEEVPALLVPVDRGRVGCALLYGPTAGVRAGQTALAARYVRERWHPTEVIWVCDSYVRTTESLEEDLPPGAEDPSAQEALALMHATSEVQEGRVVRHVSLRYGRDDRGQLTTSEEPAEWAETMGSPMDAAVASAVALELPGVPLELPTEPGALTEAGIVVLDGSPFN